MNLHGLVTSIKSVRHGCSVCSLPRVSQDRTNVDKANLSHRLLQIQHVVQPGSVLFIRVTTLGILCWNCIANIVLRLTWSTLDFGCKGFRRGGRLVILNKIAHIKFSKSEMKEILSNCRWRRWFLLGEGPGMLPSPILLLAYCSCWALMALQVF